MNAFTTKNPQIDAFHRQRSKCIDAFAELEETVVSVQLFVKMKPSSDSLGQKIESLRAAQSTQRLTDESRSNLYAALDKCTALNAVRNDLVHSKMRFLENELGSFAIFANTKNCRAFHQQAQMLTLEGLRHLYAETTEAIKELQAILINRPSSPPPPSPGAATGP
ncbi:MAG: hypothetical protein ACKOQ3_06905 [Novosphingobium sp.]